MGRGGEVEEGGGGVLVGREVLMDFRLVSQFLFTQGRRCWREEGGDKEEKQTANSGAQTEGRGRGWGLLN